MASREIGSVFIRVRPDADGFRRDAQRQIRQQGPIDAKAEVDLDDSRLARDKARAEREANRRPIELDVEFDIDSRLRGVEDALKELSHLGDGADETRRKVDGLTKAMKELHGSFPDSEWRKSIESIRQDLSKLVKEGGEVTVSPDVDRSKLGELGKSIDNEVSKPRKFNITVEREDWNSIETAIERIDKLLEPSTRRVSIEVENDEAGLRQARAKLAALQEDASVTIEIKEDQEGLRQALSRFRSTLRRMQPSVTLSVEANEDALREAIGEIEDRLRRMRPVSVEVDEDSLESVRKALESLDREIEGDVHRRYSVNLDDGSLQDARGEIADLESRLKDALDADVELGTRGAYRDYEALKADLESRNITVPVGVRPDLSEITRAYLAMRAAMPTIPVRTRLDRTSLLATRLGLKALGADAHVVNIRTQLTGLARVEAALLRASRARVVRMRVSLLGRGWQTIRGGFRSLAGLGDMDEMIQTFERVTQRLDVMGTQVATMGSIIGSVVNMATHAFGGLLVTLADVGRSFGLIAAAPTAILAGWAGLHTHNAIWGGFSDALEGYADAMEKLPPNAQRAVRAIQALSEQVNDSIQDGFWEVMADEITRFADTVAPVLERGMNRTAQIYGEGLSGMLDLAQAWAESGALGAAFSNINRMFEGVASGAVEFFDAFMTVGLRASRLFPRLGHSFEQLMSGLNQWTQWAVETGRIDRWITNAVDTVRQLVQATGHLGSMMSSLTGAFRRAGIQGLPAFVRGLERASEVMASPVWQFRMGNIFEGMAIGARRTWQGVERLATAFYDAHQWARELAIVTGEIGGLGLERLADVISNPIFQRGSLDLFDGVRDALHILQPTFDYLANILGELGTIAGEIIREMAPGINTLMGIFSDILTRLGPQITRLVGPLTDFIDNLGHTMRWNVNNIVIPALSGLLWLFEQLPQVMQRFVALAMVASRWLPTLGQGFRKLIAGTTGFGAMGPRNPMLLTLSNITTAAKNASHPLRNVARDLRGVGTAMGGMARFGLGRAVTAPLALIPGVIGREMGRADARMRAGMRVLRMNLASGLAALGPVASRNLAALGANIWRGLSSALALFGGLPGLALIGIITALGTVRARAAEAEREIDSMFRAMQQGDDQAVFDQLFDALGDELRVARDLGFDISKIMDTLVSGGNIKEATADIQALEDALRRAHLAAQNEAWGDKDAWSRVSAEDLALLEQYGITSNTAAHEIEGLYRDVQAANKGFQEQSGVVAQATDLIKLGADAMGDAGEQAPRTAAEARRMAEAALEAGESFHDASEGAITFSQAIATLGDGHQSADARIAAMSQAMKMLSGEYSDSADIVVESWNRTQQAMRTAEEGAGASGKIIGSAADGIATDYESMSERQVLAIQGATELHEAAMGRAVDAYDKAIAAGETHEEAVRLAGKAYSSIDGDIENFIETMGMSAEEAEVFRAEMERLQSVSDIEAVLQLTNLSDQEIQMAYDSLVDLRKAGVDIDGADWMAFISANPEQALLAVSNTETALLNFEAHEYMASLDATNMDVLAAVAEAVGAGELWEGGDYAAALVAIADLGDLDAAVDAVWEWDQTQAEATFSSRDEVSDLLQELVPQLGEFEGEYTATFLENGGSDLNSTISTLNDTLRQIAEEVWGVTFDSNADEVSEDTQGLLDVADRLNLLNPRVDIDTNADEARNTIGHVLDFLGIFGQTKSTATVDARDEATPVVGGALYTVGMFNGAHALAHIDADDDASPKANGARAVLDLIPRTVTSLLTGSGNLEERAGAARAAIDLVPGSRETLLSASDGISGPARTARDEVQAIPDKRTSTLSIASHMIYIRFANAAKRATEAIPKDWRTLISMPSARMYVAQANSARSAVMAVPRIWTTRIMAFSNVASVAGAARRALASIPSNRTVRINTIRTGNTAMADGGMLNSSGAQFFANGGFKENHVAQIARPQTQLRVWAEPETGGEAYIPLAASKRARSTAIWRETGRRLGVYAEGGVVGGERSDRASGPTFSIVNHYPQAEPTSVSTQRAMALLGMGGGDWD